MIVKEDSVRILVFPSCNEPGLEVIEALIGHPRIEIFGASSLPPDHDPSRCILGENHFYIPILGEPNFRSYVQEICQKNAIDAIFPTVDVLVQELCGWGNIRCIGPSYKLAHRAMSKSATYEALDGVVPTPRVFDPDTMELPAFAKPDIGSGSGGARMIRTQAELEQAILENGLLVQEYLPGAEYTVDCLSRNRGELIVSSVRERLSYSGGISKVAACVERPDLDEYAKAISETWGLSGPWFAQFKEDANGEPCLMEVNVRIGGSSGISRLSGVNIPLMAVLEAFGVDVVAPARMSNVVVTRRLDLKGSVSDFDHVIWDLDDTLVHEGNTPDPEMVTWLYRFRNMGKTQFLITRNVDPTAVLERVGIPIAFFADIVSTNDKVAEFGRFLRTQELKPERVISVNDSGAEKVSLGREIPELRTIAPDAMGILRRF